VKVAVVGGGIAGLTAALRLGQAGVDVEVLEAGTPGGVVGTRRDAGFVHELAATGFLAAADGAIALCDELGVERVAANKAAKRRWIYIDGALRALPAGPLDLVRTDLLTWRGKLALLREPLRPARDVDAQGDESVHAFAARRFGPEVARAIVAPYVTGVFAADAHDVSLAAGFPQLAAFDRAGGVVRGMVRALRKRSREPAERRGLHAPRAGMAALVDALVTALGDRVVTGATVTRVAPAPGPVGPGVAVELATGTRRYDAAVLATPARVAAELVATGVPELARPIAAIERAPAALVYLGFAAADAGAVARDAFGFLVAHGEELRVLGVVFESTVWPGRAPEGHVLMRCIFGGARDPAAAALPEAALVAQARADVGAALGVTAAPVHTAIARVARGIAQYPVGHRDRVATLDSLAGQHRLVLAGADYHGVAINEVIADARRVVHEVRAWA
jgi:oxygen-dependent protoporphyrinogen oxidase